MIVSPIKQPRSLHAFPGVPLRWCTLGAVENCPNGPVDQDRVSVSLSYVAEIMKRSERPLHSLYAIGYSKAYMDIVKRFQVMVIRSSLAVG